MGSGQRIFREGDRVRIVSSRLWMPDRNGTIKRVENRIGNRLLMKFDRDELGLWHDQDEDPVLRLGEGDLIFIEESLSRAA